MTSNEIKERLHLHALWVQGAEKGMRADFQGANLIGANLKGAYLEGANLIGADLEGADLIGAILDGVVKETKYYKKSYKYSSMLIITDSELYIKMGCYLRTKAEWRADFWNNPEEFPKDSEQGARRLAAMNMMLREIGKDEIKG